MLEGEVDKEKLIVPSGLKSCFSTTLYIYQMVVVRSVLGVGGLMLLMATRRQPV